MTDVDNNSVNETVESKRDLVWEKLQRREDERQADIEKKRAKRESSSVVNEKASYFTESVGKAKTELQIKLNKTEHLEKSSLSDHFDTISIDIQKLQKYLSESIMFLPSYDVRVTQQTLKEFQELLQEQQDRFLPKKKFAFKARKREAQKNPNIPAAAAVAATNDIVDVFDSLDTRCGFQDLVGERVIKHQEEIDNEDVGLYRLKECEVDLYGSPSTVHMSGLRQCRVFCGAVKTSVFIDNCSDCTFVVACQQLRCHTTTNSDLYLHVTSNPIVEDCTRVRFAPYNLQYEGIESHFASAGLDKNRNNWDHVNDFNWLAADAPSPNWTTIPEADRILDWHLK